MAPAPPQVARDQIVVAGGQPAAGKPQKKAALVEKVHDGVMLGPRRNAHIGEHENRRPFPKEGDDGVARGLMRLADVREGLQRALEVVARREQRLRYVGARPGGDCDAPPTRTVVDEPGRAGGPLAFDHDLGGFVAQFDRQLETARGHEFRAEVERSPGDFAAFGVESAGRTLRRRPFVRADEASRQGAGFVFDAGDGARASSVGHDLDRSPQRGEPRGKAVRPAEFDPVRDPQDVRLRLAREKRLDRRHCIRPIGLVGRGRQRA